jgi:Sec-independent protein translocase protein TatA
LFQIGLPEFLLILFIILIFLKPRELPAAARRIGRLVQEIRTMRENFLREMRKLEPEIREAAAPAPAAEDDPRARHMVIPAAGGTHRLGCRIHATLPAEAPVSIHLCISTGMGDRIVFQGVIRHAVESAGRGARIVAVTYDIGEGYFVKDYAPLPHETWTIPWPARSDALEESIADIVRGIAASLFPDAPSLQVADYRNDGRPGEAGAGIRSVELYDHYSRTIAPLGIYPEFRIDGGALEKARADVAGRIPGFGKEPLVALHSRERECMAYKNPRRGDLDRLARLLKECGTRLILFAEQEGSSGGLERLCDYTCPFDPTLQTAASVLSLCDAFVGGDSGPAHLAAAVGTPVVSLHPPSPASLNGPFCDGARLARVAGRIVEEDGRAALAFDVEAAASRLSEFLDRRNSL